MAAGTVLAVIALAGAFYYPGPGAADRPTPACASALVVGLRGNGDTADAGHGMGDDSWAVAGRLGGRLAGRLGVAMMGFPYRTGPWWRIGGDVRSGAAALLAFLEDRHRRCPSERLVLIGQSEGAAVVHLTLPSLGDRLAAATLLADPLRVASSGFDDLESPYDGILVPFLVGGWQGVRPMHDVVPTSMTARVRSYCLRDDPVCNASPTAIWQRTDRDVHTTYRHNPNGVADRAAEFAAALLLR